MCALNISFAPQQPGTAELTAVIQISGNAPQNPLIIKLSGQPEQAAATVTPAGPLMFGSQLVGTSSAVQNVTITNSGMTGTSLTVGTPAITPAASANYFELANSCKTGLAAGAMCTIGVTFAPPAAGAPGGGWAPPAPAPTPVPAPGKSRVFSSGSYSTCSQSGRR